MSELEIVTKIVNVIDGKRGQNIRALRIDDLTIIANYFVIANGTSTTHVKSLADEVEYKLSLQGVKPLKSDVYKGSEWVVLDYGNIIVHIFLERAREFYSLDTLWSDGIVIDVPIEPEE